MHHNQSTAGAKKRECTKIGGICKFYQIGEEYAICIIGYGAMNAPASLSTISSISSNSPFSLPPFLSLSRSLSSLSLRSLSLARSVSVSICLYLSHQRPVLTWSFWHRIKLE